MVLEAQKHQLEQRLMESSQPNIPQQNGLISLCLMLDCSPPKVGFSVSPNPCQLEPCHLDPHTLVESGFHVGLSCGSSFLAKQHHDLHLIHNCHDPLQDYMF
jgi:hypothetical protein